MVKLIATDLDGTLLNEHSEVSEENANAIKKAMDKGVQFVVATGRSLSAATKPLHKVGITCPIICLNGANIYDIERNLLRSIPMDLDLCREIVKACPTDDIYLEFYTNDGVYSVSREYFIKVLMDIVKSANPDATEEELREAAHNRIQNEDITVIKSNEDIFTFKDLVIYKILVFSLKKEVLSSLYKRFEHETNLAVTSSGDINLEFNHPDAQKGIALQIYSSSLGINMNEVMALGDNFNDKDMLERVGYSVAMGNSPDEIKRLCKFTTKTNVEYGVAYAIEEMLKENFK
ncbi:Cof-type HAD-IIB family hydrolase [Niallia sp. XMNu-256]|uniref:Cof-type HAD-IIB family hydrolase n=1 Tax=Niallia sp. XMNu-256 TaxID=3082444 RepID=UPI0030D39F8E